MADYAARDDMEKVYGQANIKQWAKMSGNGSADEIAGRVTWSLELATSMINDRLYLGPYTIPFVTPYPVQLISQCAALAGVLLYESRGVADSEDSEDGAHKLRNHRRNFEAFIKGILAGQIRFVGLELATSYPKAIIDGN